MQCFLQFRLGSHKLPVVVDRFAGGQHVARACTQCGGVAVVDEMHMNFEGPALHPCRQQYAPECSTKTNTIRWVFAQQDYMLLVNFVLSCFFCPNLTLGFFYM